MPKKKNASSLISELKRKTRRTYASEEKVRIVIDGMRGERTISGVEVVRMIKKNQLLNPKSSTYKSFISLAGSVAFKVSKN